MRTTITHESYQALRTLADRKKCYLNFIQERLRVEEVNNLVDLQLQLIKTEKAEARKNRFINAIKAFGTINEFSVWRYTQLLTTENTATNLTTIPC